jgi:type VI secretion system protein VasG
MQQIIRLQLGRIKRRLADNHGAQFSYDPEVIAEIANRCREVESGARNVDHILTRTLLPEMSGEFLSKMASGEAISQVHIGVGEGGRFNYQIS